jgi:dipeptidyl-peptidase-4
MKNYRSIVNDTRYKETPMKLIKFVLFLFFAANVLIFYGHTEDFKKLSVDQAIKGRLLKPLPQILGWKDDRHYYQYSEGDFFKVNAATGKSELLFESKTGKDLQKNDFYLDDAVDRTVDFNRFLFVKEKTIFMFHREENKLLPLINTSEIPQNPTFSPDGTKIAYTMAGNLFVFELTQKKPIQLTQDGSQDILNGYASWVYYEEILGRRSNYKAFWWSPDSSRIALMKFDQSIVPIFPIYNANGIYGSLERMRYPKPGFPNPKVKIGIVNLKNRQPLWINFVDKDKTDHYLAFPTWNKKGDKLYSQWLNRGQDHIEILVYDLNNRGVRSVYEEKQQEWVEFYENRDLYILENDDLLIRSSKDGWYHIYYISSQGKKKQLTKGEWSVTAVECVDEKTKYIYFSARKEDSTEVDFYKTDYQGKQIKKLTDFKGTHRVKVSPSGHYFLDTYSAINTPPRIELRDNQGKLVRKIEDSRTPEMEAYHLAKGDLFRIKTDDGIELPALWYLPPNLDKSKKYPVIVRVYGGPGSASVGNRYSRSLQTYYLAQEGIITLIVDHRGSGHFGKKGMALMHRHLGKWEMHDYIQVVKYLRTLSFIDSEKIGITGGSYGGYAAAMALTYGADYFQYGIAGAPVIDWKLYDSVYTERYMDTPRENPEGYKNSSVLTYAHQLKGELRITHGTMDDNVHAQNTLQFIDRILDAGKTVELMLYPGERHGIRGNKRSEYNMSSLNFWFKHLLDRRLKN